MPQTIIDLGRAVKTKYPQYADIDDAELGRRVKTKYPVYADYMDAPAAPGPPHVDMQTLPPTAMQQFGQAALDQVKALPGAVANTIMHPLANSPFGQEVQYATDPKYAAGVDQQMTAAFDQSPAQLAGGVTGQGVNAGLMTLAGEGMSAVPYGRVATGTRGAVRGAARAAVEPVVHGTHRIPLPAPIAGALAGHYLGELAGPMGGKVGALVGGAYPIVKGAMNGAREALAFDPNASALAAPTNIPAAPAPVFKPRVEEVPRSIQPGPPLPAAKLPQSETPRPVAPGPPLPAAKFPQPEPPRPIQPGPPLPARAPLATPGEAAVIPQPLVVPKTMAAGAGAAPPEGSLVVPPIPGATHLTPRYQEIGSGQAHAVAQAAQAKDLQFAQHLQSKGFTPELVDRMTPEEMNKVRQDVNRTYGKKYAMSKRGHEAFKKDVIAQMNDASNTSASTQ